MPQEPPPRRPAAPVPGTHRHEQLGRVAEAAQEDHDVHALGQARDLAEPDHELVLLRELLWWLLVPLELPDQGPLVLGGQEAQQQLQEVEAQDLLVVPAGRGHPWHCQTLPQVPKPPCHSRLVPSSFHPHSWFLHHSIFPYLDPASLYLPIWIPPSLCLWSPHPFISYLVPASLPLSASGPAPLQPHNCSLRPSVSLCLISHSCISPSPHLITPSLHLSVSCPCIPTLIPASHQTLHHANSLVHMGCARPYPDLAPPQGGTLTSRWPCRCPGRCGRPCAG